MPSDVGLQIGDCPHDDCTHGFADTVAEALAATRAELEADELAHAAHHAAVAVYLDPASEEARAELAGVIKRASDPLALWPEESAFPGHVAARAQAHAAQGELGPAFLNLASLAVDEPDKRFLSWAAEWFSSEKGALRRASPKQLTRAVDVLIKPHFGELWPRLSRARRASLKAFRPVLTKLLKAHPASPGLQMGGAVYLYLVGKYKLAASVAQRAHKQVPLSISALWLGQIHHKLGDTQNAVRQLKHALELQPPKPEAYLALGDVHVETKRYKQAGAWYKKALQHESLWGRAEAGRLAARYGALGDDDALAALRAEAQTGNARARALLRVVGHPLPAPRPYVDALPLVSDPVLATLARLIESAPLALQGQGARLAIRTLPAPSAMLTLDLLGDALDMSTLVSVRTIPDPDPREPIADVEVRLWSYDGTLATPALEPPTAETQAQVAALVVEPFDLQVWTERAAALTAALGASAREELLAVTVHPPELPDEHAALAWGWVLRVQLAAALGLAALDDGWAGSRRRQALHDLVLGTSDWTVAAGLVALGVVAQRDAAAAAEALTWCDTLLERAAVGDHCAWAHALTVVALSLPGLEDAPRERFRALQRRLDLDDQ